MIMHVPLYLIEDSQEVPLEGKHVWLRDMVSRKVMFSYDAFMEPFRFVALRKDTLTPDAERTPADMRVAAMATVHSFFHLRAVDPNSYSLWLCGMRSSLTEEGTNFLPEAEVLAIYRKIGYRV